MEGWETVSTGHTTAVVRRSPDGKRYAKTAKGEARAELSDERDRLEWLSLTDLLVPEILDWDDDGETATLLTSTVPGVALRDLPDSAVSGAVKGLATFLKRLHSLDRDGCPFERWLAVTVPLARVRVDEGLVDESDFDEEREGRSAESVLQEVLDLRPQAEQREIADLVLCHGDACLPNFLADPVTLEITGMVDLGRLGLADRHHDLALATRSIADQRLNPAYGPAEAEALLAAYGLPVDSARLEYYRLLDELF